LIPSWNSICSMECRPMPREQNLGEGGKGALTKFCLHLIFKAKTGILISKNNLKWSLYSFYLSYFTNKIFKIFPMCQSIFLNYYVYFDFFFLGTTNL
jgi:hypothetical protein